MQCDRPGPFRTLIHAFNRRCSAGYGVFPDLDGTSLSRTGSSSWKAFPFQKPAMSLGEPINRPSALRRYPENRKMRVNFEP
jgi:hypothetical protein